MTVANSVSKLDAAGLGAVMSKYNRRLFRVAWSILKNDAAAEDAVQETYIQCFRHADAFRGEAELGTWLPRIVINQALMQRRGARSTVSLDPVEPSAEILRHPALVSLDDPEKQVARHQLRHLLEEAIGELPEDFRLVFVLREIEGLSTEEAAALLGIDPTTVRTRLHRAKARLQLLLDQEIASVLSESFPFAGQRCARFTAKVLARLSEMGVVIVQP